MTNITKEVFDNLEQEIDVFAKNKALGSSEAKPYLDEYHSKIMIIFSHSHLRRCFKLKCLSIPCVR